MVNTMAKEVCGGGGVCAVCCLVVKVFGGQAELQCSKSRRVLRCITHMGYLHAVLLSPMGVSPCRPLKSHGGISMLFY